MFTCVAVISKFSDDQKGPRRSSAVQTSGDSIVSSLWCGAHGAHPSLADNRNRNYCYSWGNVKKVWRDKGEESHWNLQSCRSLKLMSSGSCKDVSLTREFINRVYAYLSLVSEVYGRADLEPLHSCAISASRSLHVEFMCWNHYIHGRIECHTSETRLRQINIGSGWSKDGTSRTKYSYTIGSVQDSLVEKGEASRWKPESRWKERLVS